MLTREELRSKIFSVTPETFEAIALECFHYQFSENKTYRTYCSLLGAKPEKISSLRQIPFLPIEFFKTHEVISGNYIAEKIFTSSGTTGDRNSMHYVRDLKLYEESFTRCFEYFFGDITRCCVLALLPSYLERENSSLVYMVNALIRKSSHARSAFFLHDQDALYDALLSLEKQKQKTLLIGVSFALMDVAAKFSMHLKYTSVMETGGMKGRREEITRAELHGILTRAFDVRNIFSEYGMTELLSQAYFLKDQKFHSPPWMKVLIRDINDPFNIMGADNPGAINIIDLANIDSCCFIATSDAGSLFDGAGFDVTGRIDHSDIRGCNLMVM